MTAQETEVANYVNNGVNRSRGFPQLKHEFIDRRGWTMADLLKVLRRLITDKPRILTVSDEHGSENAIYTATNVMATPNE